MELRTQKFTTALYSDCNKRAQKIGSASVITLSFIGLCDFSHILSNTSTIIDGISFNKVVAQMFGRRTVNRSTNNHIVESQASYKFREMMLNIQRCEYPSFRKVVAF